MSNTTNARVGVGSLVRRSFAIAVGVASCSTPTMTVDVDESPELLERLTGTLVYVDHPRPLTSTAFWHPSAIVLTEPRSGASARHPLPGGLLAIGVPRVDGLVRFAVGGEFGEYSLIDNVTASIDQRLDEWLQPGARLEDLSFAPSGDGVVIDSWRAMEVENVGSPHPGYVGEFLISIGDRTHTRPSDGVVAWSPDGTRLLLHAEDGLFEFRAMGEPAIDRIADHSDEPVAIGYFDGEPCMALSAKWHPEYEHKLPDWPLRTLKLPGLYATTFREIAPSRVLYESLPTEGQVVRRTEFLYVGNTWFSTLRVCEPASGQTVVVDDSYDPLYGPFWVGYTELTIRELGLRE